MQLMITCVCFWPKPWLHHVLLLVQRPLQLLYMRSLLHMLPVLAIHAAHAAPTASTSHRPVGQPPRAP